MKKYVKPIMESEMFVANEYVATCSDTVNKYYKFVCDGHGWFGTGGIVYEETNGKDGLQVTSDKSLGAYHPCQVTHYVNASEDKESVFSNGYLDPYLGRYQKVIIWKGENNDNVHVTKALREQIETVAGNFS